MYRRTYYNGFVYFETRNSPAPLGWQVWKFNIKTKDKIKILEHGANPYCFNNKLFYLDKMYLMLQTYSILYSLL